MGDNLRKFNVLVDGEYFEVEVEDIGGSPGISSCQTSCSETGSGSLRQLLPLQLLLPPLHQPAAAPVATKPAPLTADDSGGTPLSHPCRA